MSKDSQTNEIYGWVRKTREGLLEYCASLPRDVYNLERDDFGHGSIRGTLVHTADCYRFWLSEEAFGRALEPFEPEAYADPSSLPGLFAKVDEIVEAFLGKFPGDEFLRPISRKVRWMAEPFRTSGLWLMTHVVTHEFHHKGQVVAFGRILGHPAPETDLAGPDIH